MKTLYFSSAYIGAWPYAKIPPDQPVDFSSLPGWVKTWNSCNGQPWPWPWHLQRGKWCMQPINNLWLICGDNSSAPKRGHEYDPEDAHKVSCAEHQICTVFSSSHSTQCSSHNLGSSPITIHHNKLQYKTRNRCRHKLIYSKCKMQLQCTSTDPSLARWIGSHLVLFPQLSWYTRPQMMIILIGL